MGQALQREKIALILSLEKSSWVSCQAIVPNLCSLYQKSFPLADIRLFDYGEEMGQYDYFCTIQNLVKFSPHKIIICDHKPHPGKIIKGLMKSLVKELPPIYCHLYGDFSLNVVSWLDLECHLQRIRIKFIVASHRQASFVKQFIEGGERFVSYLPFPVNTNTFRFSPTRREAIKKKLQWRERGGKNFLYTGRISSQKNVIPLIKAFGDFLRISGSSAHLYIAGFFDDLGYPFFGIYPPPEFNRYKFLTQLKFYNDLIGDRIHFVGNLEKDELCDYYQACDLFLSLSLHNDEDYGMSAAEAVCCGMPFLLSDWGGHASFYTSKWPGSLVPVDPSNSFYEINLMSFIRLLIEYDQKDISIEERKQFSLLGADRFGIEGNVSRLQEIHSKPEESFSQWNKKFYDFSYCFARDSANPFGILNSFESSGEEDIEGIRARIRSRKIYRECYDEYISSI